MTCAVAKIPAAISVAEALVEPGPRDRTTPAVSMDAMMDVEPAMAQVSRPSTTALCARSSPWARRAVVSWSLKNRTVSGVRVRSARRPGWTAAGRAFAARRNNDYQCCKQHNPGQGLHGTYSLGLCSFPGAFVRRTWRRGELVFHFPCHCEDVDPGIVSDDPHRLLQRSAGNHDGS